MADIKGNVKSAVKRGMEAVSSAAGSLAANARFRVTELNLTSERKEILEGFGLVAYEAWKNGAVFPAELTEQLQRVASLDREIAEMRAEHWSTPERETEDGEERVPTLLTPEEALAASAPAGEAEAPVPSLTDDDVPALTVPSAGDIRDVLKEMRTETERMGQQFTEAGQTASVAIDAAVDPRKAVE